MLLHLSSLYGSGLIGKYQRLINRSWDRGLSGSFAAHLLAMFLTIMLLFCIGPPEIKAEMYFVKTKANNSCVEPVGYRGMTICDPDYAKLELGMNFLIK
jgi:hypothetical protein